MIHLFSKRKEGLIREEKKTLYSYVTKQNKNLDNVNLQRTNHGNILKLNGEAMV